MNKKFCVDASCISMNVPVKATIHYSAHLMAIFHNNLEKMVPE